MIPQYMRKYESNLRNFSLHFDYFSQWEGDKAKIKHHVDAAQGIMTHSKIALRVRHEQQKNILKYVSEQGGFIVEISVKLVSPYVSGLGGCHSDGEYEILDSEPTLRKYFGDTNSGAPNAVRGQLVFLDAFPKSVPTLKLDIMNPHFGKYYKGEAPPTETDNPIPVTFMSVKEETEFVFRVFASPLAEGASVSTVFDDEDREAVLAMFRRACTELGFGGKTSVGYGRFSLLVDDAARFNTPQTRPSPFPETKKQPEQIVWESANLGWHAGTGTITVALSTGQKQSCDRNLVAEETIARLKKGKPVTARVTAEKQGNLLKVVKVEV
jgi:CRISPR type III-B/RAMP module RAMP protein Cmr6